jgi:predicted MFS family arabinose efflux permease
MSTIVNDTASDLRDPQTRKEELSTVQTPSAPYVWYVVFLLAFVNLFNYMDRMAFAILLPLIKQDLALSDSELGLLVGFAFFLLYAICGIPIARWADRGIRKNLLALALATWSVMTALSGAAQNFWHLLVARVGVGVGEAGGFPSASSIVCDYVPVTRRPGVFAIQNFGAHAGTMLGMAAAGALGQAIGWRWTFVVLGLPGLVLASVLLLTLREPTRGRFDPVADEQGALPFGKAIGVLWHRRTYRLLIFYYVAISFAQSGLMQWWPSFYGRLFHLSLSSVGVQLGVALGVGTGAGLLIGGLVANKTVQQDVRAPLVLGVFATSLAPIAALASLLLPSAAISIVFASVTALLWSIAAGPVLATVYSVVAPRMRATAGAIAIFFISVLGFGAGPFCVGVLSDALKASYGDGALRYAMLITIGAFPLAIVALYAASKTLPNDLRTANGYKEGSREAGVSAETVLTEG